MNTETIKEKWDKLSQEEKGFWTDIEGNPGRWRVMSRLMETKKCPMCKKKFPDGLSTLGVIRGDFAFHMETTHGIPKEALIDMLNKLIDEHNSDNPSQRGK